MSTIVPHQFLFRFSIPVYRVARLPKRGRMLLNLPAECRLPAFGELDDVQPFGELRIGWNEKGVGVSVDVRGKRERPRCRIEEPTESDGLQLWVDTRNTQSIHRASRFCHRYAFLPRGGGSSAEEPVADQLLIHRARENARPVRVRELQVLSRVSPEAYELSAYIPAVALGGYDPEGQPRLGFTYALLDRERGLQTFSAGAGFPYEEDPSCWAEAHLVG